MAPPTYDDLNLILKLYELRREERLRAARAWFSENFRVKSLVEYHTLCPRGSENNAFARQVTTYWEMVASFITSGVLNQELFFESGRELLFVWLRLQPVIAEIRDSYKDPYHLKNLETVASAFIAHLKKHSPEGYENFAARVRGI
ncbi:MAG TPA: hypothetical protein VMG40_02300 [Bryobacteraceae bacterium]|nr:hypothetical protein [Bryobacteraceae bacterium]